MIKIMIFFSALVLALSSYGFTLNTTNGSSYDVEEIVVDLADNCENLQTTNEKLALLIQKALDNYWNNIPTSNLKMKFGSIVTVSNDFYKDPLCDSYTNGNCNVNSSLIYTNAQVLVSCNDESTDSVPFTDNNNFSHNGILGATLNNNITGDIISSSVFLINDIANNSFRLLTDEDKTAVLAHELGHAIGLGHSQVEEALMWYARTPNRKALGWDDIDGATYLYPSMQPLNCNSTTSEQPISFIFTMALSLFGLIIFTKLRFLQERT